MTCRDITELARDLALGATTVARATVYSGATLRDGLDALPEKSAVRGACAYWSGLTGDGRVPDRRDIDPVTIGTAILPHVALIDIENEGRRRFRYRLVGTEVAEIHGSDYTGRYMDELGYDEALRKIGEFYGQACDRRGACIYIGSYTTRSGITFDVARLAAPYTSGGTAVAGLFCAMEKIRPG